MDGTDMSDTAEVAQLIDTQLKAVRAEIAQLEKARAALDGQPSRRRATRRAPKRRGPQGKARRGDKLAQALAVIREQPGIKPPAIAQATGIGHGYIYNVLARAKSQGLVKDTEGQWFASEDQATK
jgi:hypothetical protein